MDNPDVPIWVTIILVLLAAFGRDIFKPILNLKGKELEADGRLKEKDNEHLRNELKKAELEISYLRTKIATTENELHDKREALGRAEGALEKVEQFLEQKYNDPK